MRSRLLCTASLLLAACASGTTGGRLEDRPPGWTYKADSGVGLNDGPMALYGPPETLALLVFACDRTSGALELATIDSDIFEGSRSISIEAGGARWNGGEQLDPPDAVAISRADIPLGHAVVDQLERGASPIVIRGEDGTTSRLPNDEVVGRVIRECRR